MLLLNFVVVLLVVFVGMTIVLTPEPQHAAVQKRFVELRSTRAASSAAAEVTQLLKTTDAAKALWLERLLHSRAADRARTLLLQSGAPTTVERLLLLCAVLGIATAALVYAATGMLLATLAGFAAAVAVPFVVLSLRRQRRLQAFEKALPDAIDMMARSLRAGHAMVAALGMLAEHAEEPVASEFAEVFRKQNFGMPLRDVLLAMTERVASADLRVVVTAMLVQKDTGGNLAEVLGRVAVVIRERMRIAGEVRTHTAQGRITGWILCALPPVMLLIINISNPGYSRVLFTDALGRKLLALGVVLLAAGAFSIRQIVNGIEV